jgi:DNA-binding transcriptional LysR family regulator
VKWTQNSAARSVCSPPPCGEGLGAWTIEHSDMVLTVPRRLATRLAKIARVRAISPPIELAEFRYIQVWHPRMDSDPAHQWLRRMFADAAVPA